MNGLLEIYSDTIPAFIKEACLSPEMQRLKGIDMNCGLNYTSYPLFKNIEPYSRYEHSLGVALIIYRFTGDIKQSLAGMFHDIATPAFSHVVDFFNGDYTKQESTEAGTSEIIRSSSVIQSILNKYCIQNSEVSDYHLYSIADIDKPGLCADRLEYLLGDMLDFGFATLDTIKRIYSNIIVLKNDQGIDELGFRDINIASEFSFLALECNKVYVCDNDRYAMEHLAQLLHRAISKNIITVDDLYIDEPHIINKLLASELANEWHNFTKLDKTLVFHNMSDTSCVMVNAKKRYVDPLVNGTRLSRLNDKYKVELNLFLKQEFNYYMKGICCNE